LRPRDPATTAKERHRRLNREIVDLLAAAVTVALRRADEMGDAIAARGGTGQISAAPSRPGWADAWTLLIVAAVSAAAIASELLLGSTRF
ncbi:MAG: energy-coupling factor transporter transmembrane protein EcfT, partial [Mycobacterium sp.]